MSPTLGGMFPNVLGDVAKHSGNIIKHVYQENFLKHTFAHGVTPGNKGVG